MKHSADSLPGIWVHGASGRMGREIREFIAESKPQVLFKGGSSRVFEGELFRQGQAVTTESLATALKGNHIDLVLDFSSITGNQLLKSAIERCEFGGSVLLGTTGLDPATLLEWEKLARKRRFRALFAPNTSLGILLLSRMIEMTSRALTDSGFDPEVIESHHLNKADAPSGTALHLAKRIMAADPNARIVTHRDGPRTPHEIGIHSVRGGGVFGDHEVRFLGQNEEIRLSHRAFGRRLFADGAVRLGLWLTRQPAGFYGLDQVDLSELRRGST